MGFYLSHASRPVGPAERWVTVLSVPNPFDELLVAFRDGHAEHGGDGGFEVFAVPSAQADGYFSSAACGHLGSIFVREPKETKSLDCHCIVGNLRTRGWAESRDAFHLFAKLARRAGAQLPSAAQEQLSARQNSPTESWLAFMWVHSPPVYNQFHGRGVWLEPFRDAANAIERGGLCGNEKPGVGGNLSVPAQRGKIDDPRASADEANTPENKPLPPREKEVLEAIPKGPDGKTAPEIARELKVGEDVVRAAVARLRRKGHDIPHETRVGYYVP